MPRGICPLLFFSEQKARSNVDLSIGADVAAAFGIKASIAERNGMISRVAGFV